MEERSKSDDDFSSDSSLKRNKKKKEGTKRRGRGWSGGRDIPLPDHLKPKSPKRSDSADRLPNASTPSRTRRGSTPVKVVKGDKKKEKEDEWKLWAEEEGRKLDEKLRRSGGRATKFREDDVVTSKVHGTDPMDMEKKSPSSIMMGVMGEDAHKGDDGTSAPSTRNRLVGFNVSGKIFVTTVQTLSQNSTRTNYFTALLNGGMPSCKDDDGNFFIDRNPKYFRAILDFLQCGTWDTEGLNEKRLAKEAVFYGVASAVASSVTDESLNELVIRSTHQQHKKAMTTILNRHKDVVDKLSEQIKTSFWEQASTVSDEGRLSLFITGRMTAEGAAANAVTWVYSTANIALVGDQRDGYYRTQHYKHWLSRLNEVLFSKALISSSNIMTKLEDPELADALKWYLKVEYDLSIEVKKRYLMLMFDEKSPLSSAEVDILNTPNVSDLYPANIKGNSSLMFEICWVG